MGFRFSLKNANTVGQLIEGNILSFMNDSLSSKDFLRSNIDFINEITDRKTNSILLSPHYYERSYRNFEFLREQWREVRPRFLAILEAEGTMNFNLRGNREIINFLSVLSSVLSSFETKALLIPGATNKDDGFMMSRRTLRELVEINAGPEILILQIMERLSESDPGIINALPQFDQAYDHIDLWPGVLLWNKKDSIFVNTPNEHVLYDVMGILNVERNFFQYLSRNFRTSKTKDNHAFFFHISDLHFGAKECDKRKSRLLSILENKLNKLNEPELAIPVITGDLMDSPSHENKSTFNDFSSLLVSKGFDKPVCILGNHDYDKGGFLKKATTEKAVIASVNDNKKVTIVEGTELAFIRFDSNTGGQWAQGMIGQDQMIEVGNELDAIPNAEKLAIVGLLHHHPMIVDNPSWYKKNFIERILSDTMFDQTMRLVDADQFLEWVDQRKINLLLHGHKHIPFLNIHNDTTIIAAGSATGKIEHKVKNKTYLSYNLIKYDMVNKKPVSCTFIAEDIIGAGARDIFMYCF